MFKKLIFFVSLLCTVLLHAQFIPLSEDANITLITIGPGDYLYDKFGHSAFRVHDPNKGIDAVFNYGVYDFDTPNFYTKFAQGKLLYKLEAFKTQPFFDSYIAQNRWIKEQKLQLTYSEKQALFSFLNNNLKPENAYYKYDFFYDNCATKIRDVLVKVLKDKITFTEDFSKENKTFRQLIQQHVHWNTWGSLGMDVAIGAVTDKKASSWEYQYLPDYVYEAAATATLTKNTGKELLVTNTETLFEAPERSQSSSFITSPLFVFIIISLLIVYGTYRDNKKQQRSRMLDTILFTVTGIIGVLLSLLWFATDHSATANNYNLLWAFPFNLLVVFFIAKKQTKRWVRRYIIFLLLLLVLLTMHWITGVQEFAFGFIPLFIALAIRYIFLLRILKK